MLNNLRTLFLDECDLRDNFRILRHLLRRSPNLEKLSVRCCKVFHFALASATLAQFILLWVTYKSFLTEIAPIRFCGREREGEKDPSLVPEPGALPVPQAKIYWDHIRKGWQNPGTGLFVAGHLRMCTNGYCNAYQSMKKRTSSSSAPGGLLVLWLILSLVTSPCNASLDRSSAACWTCFYTVSRLPNSDALPTLIHISVNHVHCMQ